jgi:hypothetical protein
MDFMFEDEVDEVGSDVEAYCPKCKGDTTHVVISKYEDEIRRVQCNPCGDVHSYRKPRGDAEDDVPEPVAARKRAMMKKLTWEEFFGKHGEKEPKPYEFREAYRENHIVFHPKFGKGFVSEVVSESKVEITFQDARRVLVHNRKDIPGLPLVAEGDGTPTPGTAAANDGARHKDHRNHKDHRDHKEAKAPVTHKETKAPVTHKDAKAPATHKDAKAPVAHKETKAPIIKPVVNAKTKAPPPVLVATSKSKPAAKPERKAAEKGDRASGAKAKTAKPARHAVTKGAPNKKAAARKK